MKVLSGVDLQNNELQNIIVHKAAEAPSPAHEGQIYYDTVKNNFFIYNNSKWLPLPTKTSELNNDSNFVNLTQEQYEALDALLDEIGEGGGGSSKNQKKYLHYVEFEFTNVPVFVSQHPEENTNYTGKFIIIDDNPDKFTQKSFVSKLKAINKNVISYNTHGSFEIPVIDGVITGYANKDWSYKITDLSFSPNGVIDIDTYNIFSFGYGEPVTSGNVSYSYSARLTEDILNSLLPIYVDVEDSVVSI